MSTRQQWVVDYSLESALILEHSQKWIMGMSIRITTLHLKVHAQQALSAAQTMTNATVSNNMGQSLQLGNHSQITLGSHQQLLSQSTFLDQLKLSRNFFHDWWASFRLRMHMYLELVLLSTRMHTHTHTFDILATCTTERL